LSFSVNPTLSSAPAPSVPARNDTPTSALAAAAQANSPAAKNTRIARI
jgi:hypothetical protein